MFFSYLLITIIIFVIVLYLKVPLPIPLLTIIPIALALSCSLAYLVKLDNPSLGAIGSIKKSMELMKGNKWKLFKLAMSIFSVYIIIVMLHVMIYAQYAGINISTEATILSKIPGYILIAISVFWFVPHTLTTLSVFYNNLVNKNENPLNKVLNIDSNSNDNNNSSTFPESIDSEVHS